MLFLGNQKFPGENEWATFLSDHGGEDNGETSWETTTFYFDVEPKYLKPALERFAAFFVAPTFDFDASEREVSDRVQFQQAKHRDGDRLSQLRCHLCADGHPRKGFGWGDARSLVAQPAAAGVDVRAEMHKFHESHYSANLMTTVVVGFESLDELQALAVDTLAPISDRDVVRPAFGGAGRPPALPPPVALPRVVRVVPQKKARTLELSWSLPPLRPHVRAKPAEYVEHLLGHEGKGSALALLKARGLATSLYAGAEDDEETSALALFSVTVELTEAGLADVDGVVCVVLGALDPRAPPRRAVGVRRDAADRIAPLPLRAARGRARVRAPPRVGDAAPPAARRAPRPTSCCASLRRTWSPTCSPPSPASCSAYVVAADDRCYEIEPWFGTSFAADAVPPARLARWQRRTTVPTLPRSLPNTFLPSDFALRHERKEEDGAAAAAAAAGAPRQPPPCC